MVANSLSEMTNGKARYYAASYKVLDLGQLFRREPMTLCWQQDVRNPRHNHQDKDDEGNPQPNHGHLLKMIAELLVALVLVLGRFGRDLFRGLSFGKLLGFLDRIVIIRVGGASCALRAKISWNPSFFVRYSR